MSEKQICRLTLGSWRTFEPKIVLSDAEKEPCDSEIDRIDEKKWIERCRKEPEFLDHPESFLVSDEARQAIFLIEYFKKKNIRIGLPTAANLCKRNAASYTIKAFHLETALPIPNLVIQRTEIEKALAPFLREQKMIFRFLSSGDTQGILPEFLEKNAREYPVKSRIDLENLIALCMPGPLMYWDEYKNNSPCRLAVAAEIARTTCGVLLYKEQQEQALQILTGCSAEESAMFLRQNSGAKFAPKSRKKLLRLIAAKQDISAEDAEDLYMRWHYYTVSTMRVKTAQQAAFKIYKQAAEKCRNKDAARKTPDRISAE